MILSKKQLVWVLVHAESFHKTIMYIQIKTLDQETIHLRRRHCVLPSRPNCLIWKLQIGNPYKSSIFTQPSLWSLLSITSAISIATSATLFIWKYFLWPSTNLVSMCARSNGKPIALNQRRKEVPQGSRCSKYMFRAPGKHRASDRLSLMIISF